MRSFTFAALIAAAALAGPARAELPPLSPQAKAAAAEAASKTAWTDKVGLYEVCLAMDKVAAGYRASAAGSGKQAPAPVETPPCADPGPYVAQVTPTANKPLESSEAHSPAGMATSPPSTNATSAELTGGSKKPLEASEAHSPAGMATSPPSSKATAAETNAGSKK